MMLETDTFIIVMDNFRSIAKEPAQTSKTNKKKTIYPLTVEGMLNGTFYSRVYDYDDERVREREYNQLVKALKAILKPGAVQETKKQPVKGDFIYK